MRRRGITNIFISLAVILAWGMIVTPACLFARQISLTSVVAKEPLAVLLDIQGTGILERGTDSYTITKSGIGFKQHDTFTLSTGSTDYAIITLNKKGTSYVKLGPGASITFLDDDGNFAITGVYVEGSGSDDYADLTFNINHASPESPFFVWTPDIVVGVRGTWFMLKVKNHTDPNPNTQILGEYKGVATWEPDDVRIYPLDVNKIGLPTNSTISKDIAIDKFSNLNLNDENVLISYTTNVTVNMSVPTGCSTPPSSPVSPVFDASLGGMYLNLTNPRKLIEVGVYNTELDVVYLGDGEIDREDIRHKKKAKHRKLKKLKHKGKHGKAKEFMEGLLEK